MVGTISKGVSVETELILAEVRPLMYVYISRKTGQKQALRFNMTLQTRQLQHCYSKE